MSCQDNLDSSEREGRARLGVTSGDERRALNACPEISQHARPVGHASPPTGRAARGGAGSRAAVLPPAAMRRAATPPPHRRVQGRVR
eukprot:CAMPEP_0118816034 /NCGR_PEP_ID=MMETSP1162-20130426/4532_1 /TAXON_ID=33656 /ORGANISM="Phaeocystis Sp, Strain CCMP2710" /LENGTH=86 /DNA_ID=CAMNT_0006746027 /DNA_START=130 /DNA_END=388 /DNA_ORIENTATION=+